MADVYDALTSTRPYKDAWSHERAVEEIVGQSGSHFDPVPGRYLQRHPRKLRRRAADVPRLTP